VLALACHHLLNARLPVMGGSMKSRMTGCAIITQRDIAGVRLITRQGNDFTSRFPLIVAAVAALPSRPFLIDGEAIVTKSGVAVFDLIRHKRHGTEAVLVAFDS
jgi:bifunctional non-homologous end joining protein LigD